MTGWFRGLGFFESGHRICFGYFVAVNQCGGLEGWSWGLFLRLVTGSFLVTPRRLHSQEDCATLLGLFLVAVIPCRALGGWS
jgi:hypothetical protein